MRVLAIQAGLGGDGGNSAVLLDRALDLLRPHAEIERASLVDDARFATHRAAVERADALVIATGTYWDSWSSVLQRFLEEATPSEATSLWLGKPAAVIVTAHSVGGKGVLSRLQGVLSTFGAQIPPMGGLVVTLASERARERNDDDGCDDLWSPDDLEVLCHNLLECTRGTRGFRAWQVDRADPARRWIR